MALHPVPIDLMARGGGEQGLPEFDILDRLFIGGAPAVALPAVDPFGDAVFDIIAVGGERDVARLGECFERLDRAHQLHTVVRAGVFAAREFLFARRFAFTDADERAPAAATGIALARAIGEDVDMRLGGHVVRSRFRPAPPPDLPCCLLYTSPSPRD